MVHYRYEQRGTVVWLKNFAKLLGVERKQNYLELPESAGKGFFYATSLRSGMSLLYANTLLHQDFLFDRLASEDAGIILFFVQIEITGEFKVHSGDQMMIEKNKNRNVIFLGSTQFPWQLKFESGTNLKAIAILFSEKLVRSFMKLDSFAHVKEYTRHNLNNLDKEQLTPDLIKLLHDIYQSDITSTFGELVLQNRALLLVEKYLDNFLSRQLPESKKTRTRKVDLEQLSMVEKSLTEEGESFPSIEKLSKMAMMSSTKLKKRFKEVYGMKLYEFYNHNRLQKARELLESGQSSVKEVAYKIGFANLSNFSKAYKKAFGILTKESKAEENHLSS